MNLNISVELVDDVIQEALRHVDRKKDEHTITVEHEDELLLARMDSRLIVQMVINLVDNAIKYTNTGGITIKLCSYELFACVEVTDTGIGIGEEEHAAVFGRFYRGNAVAEKSGGGSGLYLARSIMQQQGGYIRLSSTPGEGSTFGLYFPTAIVSKL